MFLKTMNKLICCLILFLSIPIHAAMPKRPVFELSHIQTSSAGYEQKSDSGDFKVKEINLMGNFARKETDLGNIVFGMDYKQHRIELADGFTSRTLHQVALPISLVSKQQHWTLVWQIAPSFNSDFESIGADDFTTAAMLRTAYHASANTAWVMGAAIDRSFGDSQIYPLLGLSYMPNKHWQFQLILPRPKVIYMPNIDTVLYWHAQPVGNKWNVEPSGLDQTFNVTTRAIRSGIGLEYDINQSWWLRVEAGREFKRELESVNSSGTEFDLDVEDANYFSASVLYRIQ